MRLVAKFGLALVLLYASLQVACWRTVLIARSPDQRHTVKIKEWCIPPDCGIKVELTTQFLPIVLSQVGDAGLVFAHVAWIPDSSAVGIFVVNAYGSDILTAYDALRATPIPFERVHVAVSRSIAEQYGLSSTDLAQYGGDAIQWVISNRDRAHKLYHVAH